MKKSILSILLAICMVVTLVPPVFAASTDNCTGACTHQAAIGSTHYDTLLEAFNAVNDGETIKILTSITFTSSTVAYDDGIYVDGIRYNGDKNFTVDFNGKTVTDDGCVNDYLFYINNKGEKANEITFKNGTIVSKNGCWSTICVGADSSDMKTTLNLNGMTIENSNGSSFQGNTVVRCRGYLSGTTVNVNSGTVITSDNASYGITASAGSVVNVNSGAKIIQKNSTGHNGNHTCAAAGGHGTINVYDGAELVSDFYGIHTFTTGNPVVNVYGGTITATGTAEALVSYVYDNCGYASTVNVSGGTISGGLKSANGDSEIVVAGGSFTVDPTEYCTDGYVGEASGNGTYGLGLDPAVFPNGESDLAATAANGAYATLQEAIDAAQPGDTVTVMNDIVLTASVTVAADDEIILDLNGKKVSMNDSSGAACYMFKNYGKLTIKDSSTDETGKITFKTTTPSPTNSYSASTIGNAGHLTVESGTVENTTYPGGACYAIDTLWYSNDVSITITGGRIIGARIAIRQVVFSKTAKNVLTVTDGAYIEGGYAAIQTHAYSAPGCLAEVNITGGTIKADGGYAYYTSYAHADGHTETDIEITGGDFSGAIFIYNSKKGSDAEEFKNVSITGGTFADDVLIYTKDADGESNYIPAISGGTFSVPSPEGCMVDGFALDSYTDEDGNTVYGAAPFYTVTIVTDPVGGTVVLTDAEGNVIEPEADGTYKLFNGIYSYKATKDGYFPKGDSFKVNGRDRRVTVFLDPVVFVPVRPTTPPMVPNKPDIVIPTVKNPFTDVSKDAYYYDAVIWAIANKVTGGTTPTTFSPEAVCTRAHAVTFIWNALGKPEPTNTETVFTDVSEDAYYYKAMLWAVENGIIYGSSDTTFSPEAECTRGQIVTMLWRNAGCPASNETNAFTDVDASDYYYTAVLWAIENGITLGTSDTTFSPEAECTRGQIVTFLFRELGDK